MSLLNLNKEVFLFKKMWRLNMSKIKIIYTDAQSVVDSIKKTNNI